MGEKRNERLDCITVLTEVTFQLSEMKQFDLFCSQAVQFSGKKINENVTVKN